MTHHTNTYHVTVMAFGRILYEKVEAVTRAEAEAKMLDKIGFRVVSTPRKVKV